MSVALSYFLKVLAMTVYGRFTYTVDGFLPAPRIVGSIIQCSCDAAVEFEGSSR